MQVKMKKGILVFLIVIAVLNPIHGKFDRLKRFVDLDISIPFFRDKCDYPLFTGVCLARMKRYFFDGETCKEFVYGGCGGNPNNFKTKEQCMKECEHKRDNGKSDRDRAPIFPPLFPSNEFLPPAVCDLPVEVGMCKAGLPRYYFDGEKCDTFIFGGCGGNENNFRTLEQCLDKCGHKIPDGDNETSDPEEE